VIVFVVLLHPIEPDDLLAVCCRDKVTPLAQIAAKFDGLRWKVNFEKVSDNVASLAHRGKGDSLIARNHNFFGAGQRQQFYLGHLLVP
jgi:hypothetical protein